MAFAVARSKRSANEFRCPVIGCYGRFSSVQTLEEHWRYGCSSPLNPLQGFPDMKPPLGSPAFACPKCYPIESSPSIAGCSRHMRLTDGHKDPVLQPLSISGYGCRQCFSIFPTKEEATKHIEENLHVLAFSSYRGDKSSSYLALAIPQRILAGLCEVVGAVPWYVKCTDCKHNFGPYNDTLDNMALRRNHKLRYHLGLGHTLLAKSGKDLNTVLDEFFSEEYTCSRCLLLLDACPSSKLHKCLDKKEGTVVKVDSLPLQEYLFRKALVLISSGPPRHENPVLALAAPRLPTRRQRFPLTGIKNTPVFWNNVNSIIDMIPKMSISGLGAEGNAGSRTLRMPDSGVAPKEVAPELEVSSSVKCSKSVISLSSDSESDCEVLHMSLNSSVTPIVIDDSPKPLLSANLHSANPKSANLHSANPKSAVITSSISASPSRINSQPCIKISLSSLKPGNSSMSPVSSPPRSRKRAAVDDASERRSKRCKPSNSSAERLNPNCSRSVLPDFIPLTKGSASVNAKSSGTFLQSFSVTISNETKKHFSSFARSSDESFAVSSSSDSKSVTDHRMTQNPSMDTSTSSDLSPTRENSDDSVPRNLNTMKHIIFLDLDNWARFFQRLPKNLPEGMFVWGFYGGRTEWHEPLWSPVYSDAKRRGLVHVHEKCGTTKDAADFALCLMVGRADERIPKNIPFTILSGDRGFEELERQYRGKKRRVVVITPHNVNEEELFLLIKSVADS